jgi:hypothetical protein
MRIPRLLYISMSVLLVVPILIPTRTDATAVSGEHTLTAMQATTATAECPVTLPNGRQFTAEPQGGNHGNDALITALWTAGRVEFKPGGPGCVEPDGYLGMKWPWWHLGRGRLTIEGRRLDGPAGPLRAHINSGYGDAGFQATGLLFAGPGCWEVTGRVGDASLSFVTLVTKTAQGPAPRCSALFGGFRPGAQAPKQE